MSSTFTTTSTFTRTHAKHLASKVIADLYQCYIHYDHPDFDTIEDYEGELIEMLADEYVESYEFGFKKDDKRVLTFRYTVGADGRLHGDSDPGGIYAKATVASATYFNLLSYSQKWWNLTDTRRASIESGLPIQRTPSSHPGDGDGYWQVDHAYTAGGVSVDRKTFRPW
jgi:hypothetical protein